MRSLSQWLSYIGSVHHRSVDLGLERVAAVAQSMRLLPVSYRTIVVAGTNGKGSSVALATQILINAGHRTGCYTSPHLVNYRERIQIDGSWIPEAELCAGFAQIDTARGETPLTYFEFGTLAALWWFRLMQVDVAILETGMGGRLDAVNIVDADAALITNIDIDHSAWLGPDRSSIAVEKAGIMRPGKPAVCSDPRPPESLLREAAARQTPLHCLQRDFGYTRQGDHWLWWARTRPDPVVLPLPPLAQGAQLENAAGVLMILDLVAGLLPVSATAVATAVASAHAPGRGEELPGPPPVALDVAHNAAAVRLLHERLALRKIAGMTRAVFGVLVDKPLTELITIMAPVVGAWYLCDLHNERAMPMTELHTVVTRICPNTPVFIHDDPVSAFVEARAACEDDDRICVFGSFYLVGAILAQRRQLGI